MRQITELFLGICVPYGRPHGDIDVKIRAALSEAIIRASGLTVRGSVRPLYAEIGESIDTFFGTQVNVSAIPTITPIGTAERHKLLATKTGTATPAVAGLHLRSGLVDEFHDRNLPPDLKAKPRREAGVRQEQTSKTTVS
jgi:hypothetical protein